jgi:hypothetical protein
MILTVNRLIAVLQAVADEGHGNCHIEARNQAGDMEMVCLDNVFVESDQHGVFLLKIDPAVENKIASMQCKESNDE